MAIFDFLKNKKEDNKFVGRWVQSLKVFQLLGQEFSDEDIKMALEKDKIEREELVKEIEKIEENIGTGDLKHIFGAAEAHQEMSNIITKGFQNCVLSNDSNLEKRCFEILKQSKNVLQNEANKQDGKNLNLNKAEHLLKAMGDFANGNLGGLLSREKGSEQIGDSEKAWFIIRLLNNPGSLKLTFMLMKDLNKNEIMDLADKLLAAGKLTEDALNEISNNFDGLFEMGQEYQKNNNLV
ncbi:MAG: hypothetical protein WC609_00470 [Candidatus Paceibacterota bacterium]|jgi:hypothetical protein